MIFFCLIQDFHTFLSFHHNDLFVFHHNILITVKLGDKELFGHPKIGS